MFDVHRFGEQPLDQTVAAAAAMRRLTSLLLSQEHPNQVVEEMLSRFVEWERELLATAPRDPTPRFGADPEGVRRLYLQHALDIGSFNPCFPAYEFTSLATDSAVGVVTFPIAYEGPPGMVHGGMLGAFFDCVVQHHNCATAPSGMTRTMTVTYRRPVPLLTELRFEVNRAESDGAVTSTTRLWNDDELLCTGDVDAVVIPRERMAGFAFGLRSDRTGTPP